VLIQSFVGQGFDRLTECAVVVAADDRKLLIINDAGESDGSDLLILNNLLKTKMC